GLSAGLSHGVLARFRRLVDAPARQVSSCQQGRTPMAAVRMQAVVLGACISLALAAPSVAQEPYYKGKRITVLINFAAGGPTDIEGRLFAKHLAKHIEGQPNLIVQNMDGAGGVVGASYLGEVAPKDGTTMGYLSGTSWIY